MALVSFSSHKSAMRFHFIPLFYIQTPFAVKRLRLLPPKKRRPPIGLLWLGSMKDYNPNFSMSSFLPNPRIPCFFPTLTNPSPALSRWCFSWAAESWVRILA